MEIKSEEEMLNFGENFANHIITERATDMGGLPRSSQGHNPERMSWEGNVRQDPFHSLIIELIGDVGAGKTTFVRGLAKGLGITESITSPSFTISKSYAIPTGGRLIHYDFYRLPNPGLMADDLQENLADPANVVVIEWGESISDLLPKEHIKITINYTDTGREIIL